MTDDRSSAEIEREIEEERHALARSLEELQATFSPERLVDQTTTYIKSNGGELTENFMRQVKANPLAATMAGVGIAWLLASNSRRPAPVYDRNRHTHDPRYVGGGTDTIIDRRAYDAAAEPYTGAATYDDRTYPAAPGRLSDPYAGDFDARLEDATSDDPSAWDRAKMAVSDFTDEAKAKWLETKAKAGVQRDEATRKWDAAKLRAQQRGHDTREGAADRWASTRDSTSARFRDWQDRGRSRYADTKGRAYAKSEELRARVSEGTENMSQEARARIVRARQAAAEAQRDVEARLGQARDSGARMYDEQPLVGGLVAFGVGAAVGALLPRTETEDRYVGQHRDRLFDEAERVFEEESGKLRAVADAALDEARNVADEKLGAAQGEAEKAKANTPYGQEAVDKAEGEVRSAAQRVADRAQDEAEKQGLGQSAKAEAEKAEAKADEESKRLHG